jgi:SSS family solute:Na+ symporter
MGAIISAQGTFIILSIYAIMMFLLVYFSKKHNNSTESFLLADRKVHPIRNAISIAISWIWGPALFLSSAQAFTGGIPSVFWFLLPNFTCFYLFTIFAVKFKKFMPNGYTIPEMMKTRFNGDKSVHFSYIILTLLYQLTAIVLNSVIGAHLLHLVTGISFEYMLTAIICVALSHSLLRGFRASLLTDLVQMGVLYTFILLVIPKAIFDVGGFSMIAENLVRVANSGNIFDSKVLLYFAIPSFVTLWTGPVIDQMFYQRVMCSSKQNVVKSFISASFSYIIVPLSLSILGFIGYMIFTPGEISAQNTQLIGVLTVAKMFPIAMVYMYVFMAMSGLCSTVNSALYAISSIGCIDIYKEYFNKKGDVKKEILISRLFMLGMAALGLLIGMLAPSLLSMFFIIGVVRGAGFFPTLSSFFSRNIPPFAIPISIISTIVLCLPLSIYANAISSPALNTTASLSAVVLPLVIIILCSMLKKRKTILSA